MLRVPSGVLVAEFENDVNPVTQEYLLDAVEKGEGNGYAAVVIEMDTPGGLGSSMRDIVKGILAAKGNHGGLTTASAPFL